MTRRFRRHDQPLTSQDLHKCRQALEKFCEQNQVEPSSKEAERAAAVIIQLYQQGVQDEKQLEHILGATHGMPMQAKAPRLSGDDSAPQVR